MKKNRNIGYLFLLTTLLIEIFVPNLYAQKPLDSDSVQAPATAEMQSAGPKLVPRLESLQMANPPNSTPEEHPENAPPSLPKEGLTPLTSPATSDSPPHFYNLEGVVIEGRKSKVDTLVDLKDFNIELEEVIFSRTNFDDFFEVDLKLRPTFAK